MVTLSSNAIYHLSQENNTKKGFTFNFKPVKRRQTTVSTSLFKEALDIKTYTKQSTKLNKMIKYISDNEPNEVLEQKLNKKLTTKMKFINLLPMEKEQSLDAIKDNIDNIDHHKTNLVFNKSGNITQFIFDTKSKSDIKNNLTRKIEYLYTKYFINSALQFIISIMCLLNTYVEYEINYFEFTSNHMTAISQNSSYFFNNEIIYSEKGLFSLWVSFFCSILLWMTILYEIYLFGKEAKYKYFISLSVYFSQKVDVISYAFYFLLFVPHPNPIFCNIFIKNENLKYNSLTVYSVNSIMSILGLFKIWFIIKFYLIIGTFSEPRTRRVGEMNNVYVGLLFSIKSTMVKQPYRIFFILLIIGLLFSVFSLRVFERELDFITKLDFGNYWNTCWCLIITILTVGYGDYVPSTSPGRFIVVATTFYGVFLASMLIVSLTNFLIFNENEKNTFLLIKRIKLKEEQERLSAKLLVKYIKLFVNMKKNRVTNDKAVATRKDIMFYLHLFKIKTKEIESTYPAYSTEDCILENLEYLELEIEALTEKYMIENYGNEEIK